MRFATDLRICRHELLHARCPRVTRGLPARVELAREPAPAAFVVLSFAFEESLAILIDSATFPTWGAHAFVAALTHYAPLGAGLTVATEHAFRGLFAPLDPPPVRVVGSTVCVGVRCGVIRLLLLWGATFSGGRRHRHSEVGLVL
jgi:hypothetical protein